MKNATMAMMIEVTKTMKVSFGNESYASEGMYRVEVRDVIRQKDGKVVNPSGVELRAGFGGIAPVRR
jgi:hypothetical protein